MLRSFPRVLAPVARTHAVRAMSTAAPAVQAPEVQQTMDFLKKYKLDQWYVQLPIGIVLAVPVIKHEMLILSEETMLVGCFAAFCGTSYILLNDSIAEMLSAKGKRIMAEHNAVEDEVIESIKGSIDMHKKVLKMYDEFPAMEGILAAHLENQKAAKIGQIKHEFHASIIKELNQLVAQEEAAKLKMINELIDGAADSVTKSLRGDKKASAAYLAESIASIGNPNAKGKTVEGLFSTYFKAAK